MEEDQIRCKKVGDEGDRRRRGPEAGRRGPKAERTRGGENWRRKKDEDSRRPEGIEDGGDRRLRELERKRSEVEGSPKRLGKWTLNRKEAQQ